MVSGKHYDVLIVGARCAGAATAMLAARQGLRVLAIDAGEAGSDTVSTHALMRAGVMQLHRWGVLPRIVAAGTPAIRTTTFHYGDETLSIAIKPGHGIDALYAPRRSLLDRTLAESAQGSGAELRHGWRLTDLIRNRSGQVAGGIVVDRQGRCAEVHAGLVIGADGAGSAVARLAGAMPLHEGRHAGAVLYGHWAGLRQSGYHWHYRENLSAGVIPTNDGRHCVFVAMRPERFRGEARQDPLAAYHRLLHEISPPLAAELRGAELESRIWAFPGRRGFMRQPWGRGWALVGDAGYFKDPLTAHGITDALRDAELVARAAVEGSEKAFADYAAIREALSLELFEASDAIASFDWDIEALRGHHQALHRAMKTEVDHITTMALSLPAEVIIREKAA
ncbi:MAG: NAD(P)/FAD-dependent oxidoreductase [Rhodopila sp.]